MPSDGLELSLQAMMYQALDAPLGIAIRASDQQRVLKRLYVAREKLNAPELSGLRFSKMQPNEIWISHQPAPSTNPGAQGAQT